MKMLVSSVARAAPTLALAELLPPLFRKLLPRWTPGSQPTPLHDTGLSESETKWLMSGLIATVRFGGEALLKYRGELEAVVAAALTDDRGMQVPKHGVKLLRRVLFSITATYVPRDFRICSAPEWDHLLATRRGQDKSSQDWPLKWWGWTPPWWSTGSLSVEWHVPS